MEIGLLTAAFVILDGVLWYERPSPNIWLFGSLVLGGAWGVGFMRLITRDRG